MTSARDNCTVSIVIRCFNEEKHIGNLLDAVSRQTIRVNEVIVVDSGSTDMTLDVVKRYPVRLIQITPQEFTFGFSLNRGCAEASGEFLIFASAHVLPARNDWVEQLLSPFEDPRVALVYGRQTGNKHSKFSEQQIFAKQYPAESNEHQQTPFCNNANAAIRKSLWREHHYDESLSGLEDVEWAKWALGKGYRIVYKAEAMIFHIHEETATRVFNRYKREAIALKRIIPDTHLTLWEFIKLWFTNTAFDLLRAMKQRVLLRNCIDIVVFRMMQYWGTYRGIHYRSALSHEMIVKFYYPRQIAFFKLGKNGQAKSQEYKRLSTSMNAHE